MFLVWLRYGRNNLSYHILYMKKLRVLQVTRFLNIGGLETVVMRLSKQLVKEGLEVDILCLCGVDKEYIKELEGLDITIYSILKKGRWDFYFFKRVAEFIRTEQYDIVHAHSGCFLYAAIFSKMAGIKKTFFTAHGIPIFTAFRYRVEDNLACLLTKRVISVSSEIQQFMKSWLLCSSVKFVTIVNGIDTSLFRQVATLENKRRIRRKYNLPVKCKIIGSVGRLEAVKNYEMLLYVVRILLDRGALDISCVVVGEGAQYDFLVDLACKLSISEKVYFLGMQYDIAEIVSSFDVFVLTSITEGTSISLLEAQSCKVPAVVTDVGGNGYVVEHGVTGYVCAVNDTERMAHNISAMLCDSEGLEQMGNKARLRVLELFSLETMTQKYMKIYLEL